MRVAFEPSFDACGDRLAADEQEHPIGSHFLCLAVGLSPKNDAL